MKIFFILIAITLLFCPGVFGQTPPPGDVGPNVMFYQSAAVGPAGGVAGGGVFFSAEISDIGKVITGAPYTASVSTEMTQVLSDGNRINNKTTASLARDSLGRTRREETMGMVGPWQVNGPKLVFINDPTSQTNYVLDSNKQTVAVMKHAGFNAAGPERGFTVEFSGKGPGGDQPEEIKTESLGNQMMEGVSVEGKRVTRTIPAGQIGNTQPIQITSEVWTSPDLQVIIMSKHSDPRFGETVYQLTGIQRAEPDHSLFEIPSGYTVKNMPAPMGLHTSGPEGEPAPFGPIGTMGPVVK
jgi:hypothetical protein